MADTPQKKPVHPASIAAGTILLVHLSIFLWHAPSLGPFDVHAFLISLSFAAIVILVRQYLFPKLQKKQIGSVEEEWTSIVILIEEIAPLLQELLTRYQESAPVPPSVATRMQVLAQVPTDYTRVNDLAKYENDILQLLLDTLKCASLAEVRLLKKIAFQFQLIRDYSCDYHAALARLAMIPIAQWNQLSDPDRFLPFEPFKLYGVGTLIEQVDGLANALGYDPHSLEAYQ